MKPEDPERRSRIMRAVRSQDTAPELAVRRAAHGLGYRFRLHRKDLPGAPDLVFPRLGAVIFVNGCFWHGHSCPRGARVPMNNRGYWLRKIQSNRTRDRAVRSALRRLGWRCLTVWECQTKNAASLAARVRRFLERPANS